MKNWLSGVIVAIALGAVVAVFWLVATVTAGQQAPAAGAFPPYKAPRTMNGHPDLNGIWQAFVTANWDIQDHEAQPGPHPDVMGAYGAGPAGQGVVEGGDIPYQPWAAAKKKENLEKRMSADPETKCYLPGVPRLMYMPYPFQILQTPTLVTMLFEYVHATRYVHTDGTPHPSGHIDWWMGDSRGRWEGETFVIDVVDFNDQTWFDRAGNFHSDQLHVVERYTLAGPDHMNYEVTIEDPKVFTRPWKMSMMFYRRKEPGLRLLEYECYAFDREFHVTPGMTPPTGR
jgi:hypothetical protein